MLTSIGLLKIRVPLRTLRFRRKKLVDNSLHHRRFSFMPIGRLFICMRQRQHQTLSPVWTTNLESDWNTNFRKPTGNRQSWKAIKMLGFAIRYDVADLVGTQVSIVAMLPKSVQAKLPRK